jgi:hypothetical protein
LTELISPVDHDRYLLLPTYRNANAIALFLESHKAVSKVVYPGLKSHPQHDIASRQQNGYGAMITFYCVGDKEQSAIILEKLRVFALAESLGAVESLAGEIGFGNVSVSNSMLLLTTDYSFNRTFSRMPLPDDSCVSAR